MRSSRRECPAAQSVTKSHALPLRRAALGFAHADKWLASYRQAIGGSSCRTGAGSAPRCGAKTTTTGQHRHPARKGSGRPSPWRPCDQHGSAPSLVKRDISPLRHFCLISSRRVSQRCRLPLTLFCQFIEFVSQVASERPEHAVCVPTGSQGVVGFPLNA